MFVFFTAGDVTLKSKNLNDHKLLDDEEGNITIFFTYKYQFF